MFNVSVHSDNPTVYQGELADLLCIVTVEGVVPEPGMLLNFILFLFFGNISITFTVLYNTGNWDTTRIVLEIKNHHKAP